MVSPAPPWAQIGILRSRPGHESCYSCSVWGAFACYTNVFILVVSPANIIGLNSIPSTYLPPKSSEGFFIIQPIIHKISSMTQIIFYHFWQSHVICHLKERKIIYPLRWQAAVSWLDRIDVLLSSTRDDVETHLLDHPNHSGLTIKSWLGAASWVHCQKGLSSKSAQGVLSIWMMRYQLLGIF